MAQQNRNALKHAFMTAGETPADTYTSVINTRILNNGSSKSDFLLRSVPGAGDSNGGYSQIATRFLKKYADNSRLPAGCIYSSTVDLRKIIGADLVDGGLSVLRPDSGEPSPYKKEVISPAPPSDVKIVPVGLLFLK